MVATDDTTEGPDGALCRSTLDTIRRVWYKLPPMPTEAKSQVVRLRVTDAELEFLRRVAEVEDRTVASVLRMALRELANTRDENGKRA